MLVRRNLDARSHACRQFNAICANIAADLGGLSELSEVQKRLVEAFAGAFLHVDMMSTKLLINAEVDVTAHSTAISTLVRVASRIGLQRVARDVTTLGDLMRADMDEQRRAKQEQANVDD